MSKIKELLKSLFLNPLSQSRVTKETQTNVLVSSSKGATPSILDIPKERLESLGSSINYSESASAEISNSLLHGGPKESTTTYLRPKDSPTTPTNSSKFKKYATNAQRLENEKENLREDLVRIRKDRDKWRSAWEETNSAAEQKIRQLETQVADLKDFGNGDVVSVSRSVHTDGMNVEKLKNEMAMQLGMKLKKKGLISFVESDKGYVMHIKAYIEF